jgi:hypothetical protein
MPAARLLGADFGSGRRRDHHVSPEPLGKHVLRGIAAPCTVFTLPDA